MPGASSWTDTKNGATGIDAARRLFEFIDLFVEVLDVFVGNHSG
jgi:hypothetical protein